MKKTVLGLHVTLGHTLVLQLDVLLLDWALGIDKTKNYINEKRKFKQKNFITLLLNPDR